MVPRSVLVTAIVAALVTAGVLAGAASLRDRDQGPRLDSVAGASGAPQSAEAECGDGPCRTVSSQPAGGATVALLADARGGNGQFQAGGQLVQTSVTALGARVDAGSLSCVTATVSACLVSAPLRGGRIGELFVQHDGEWKSVGKPYFSDAAAFALNNVTGTDAPELTVVESAPVLARVYALDGTVSGCTRKYSSASQLRGWPNVRLTASDLRACP